MRVNVYFLEPIDQVWWLARANEIQPNTCLFSGLTYFVVVEKLCLHIGEACVCW